MATFDRELLGNYTYTLTSGEALGINDVVASIDAGFLVFRDDKARIVLAVAAGTWTQIYEEASM